ncbi:LPS export ABC transporter periplasmic protein LptC [bacterium]|nr:LPS export ABC transporter periplasmic protein LptC [bacterium]
MNFRKSFSWFRKRKRFSAGLIAGISFVAFVYMFFSAPEITDLPEKKRGLPDFRFEDIVISEFDSGNSVWEINARQAHLYRDSDNSFLKGVAGTVYDDDKEIIAFEAPKAELNLNKSILRLIDVVASIKFDTLETNIKADELIWDGEKQSFEGRGQVQIESELGLMKGDYFLVSIPIRKIRLESNSEAHFNYTKTLPVN